jgi:hypothetical protein
MATTYLTYTQQSPSTAEGQKFTLSMWVKKSVNGTTSGLYGNTYDNTHRGYIYFNAQDTLQYYDSAGVNYTTTRVFRDNNAFYHLVIAVDTTLSSSSDRIKFYVNGVRETSFSTSSAPNQNDTLKLMNTTNTPNMGRIVEAGTSYYFSGVISHAHLTQGYTYDATPFGETDSTTGEWKIKTNVTGVTYGTNGFFILKDGNSVTDQSGNSNNFTVGGGTLTKTEDNPSNVFCTWNPNYRSARKDMTLTNGNTFIFEQNSGDSGVSGTIAVSSGKYYWEQKIAQVNGTNAAITGGLHTVEDFNESPTDAMAANTVGMRSNGNVWKGTTNLGNFTTATYNNDIIGVGFDADNGSMYFWRNGTALNSGNAIITGMDMTKTWVPFGVQHGGARVTTSTNFGNGYFQTTAVSSAGTNASGNGIFEYDVPSGYTALSTKGLNL